MSFLSFVERNDTLVLSIIAGVGSCLAGFAMCILRSRCTKINACCIRCERDVLRPGEPVPVVDKI